jgi:pSer/pThr/pTyr-binding forkhead associated (FHA) protein
MEPWGTAAVAGNGHPRRSAAGPIHASQPTIIMALITLRVLHGADRGRVFHQMATPVTIGREEGNTIQLNDDRISRYHLKLQDDRDKIVLTDLESTNGTKVNGEDIQVRIVRDGDMITLGKSLLLVGSHSDIDRRIAEIAARLPAAREGQAQRMRERLERIEAHQSDVIEDMGQVRSPLLPGGPPPLPGRLGPAQTAELAELLDYVQAVLREATEGATMRPGNEVVELDFAHWQAVLDLQARLAELLRSIGEPG